MMRIQHRDICVYKFFLHFYILTTYRRVLKSNTGLFYIIHIGIETGKKRSLFVP